MKAKIEKKIREYAKLRKNLNGIRNGIKTLFPSADFSEYENYAQEQIVINNILGR